MFSSPWPDKHEPQGVCKNGSPGEKKVKNVDASVPCPCAFPGCGARRRWETGRAQGSCCRCLYFLFKAHVLHPVRLQMSSIETKNLIPIFLIVFHQHLGRGEGGFKSQHHSHF